MAASRPPFATLWMRFHQAGRSAAETATTLGGAVAEKIQSGALRDLGAVRLSHALRASGMVIPASTHHTLQGADGAAYFYRVGDLAAFLTRQFGSAEFLAGESSDRGWSECKGVLLSRSPLSMEGGSLTLWNGRNGATPMPLAGAHSVQFWELA